MREFQDVASIAPLMDDREISWENAPRPGAARGAGRPRGTLRDPGGADTFGVEASSQASIGPRSKLYLKTMVFEGPDPDRVVRQSLPNGFS